jgi:hypothetical protein
MMYTRASLEFSSITLPKYMSTHLIGTGLEMLYDGAQCDAREVELLACLPEEWKMQEDREEYTELDYVDWPNTA